MLAPLKLGDFDLFMLGGGGHARVLLDIVALVQPAWRVAILERDISLCGAEMMGARVIGTDEMLQEIARVRPGAHFSVGLGTVGNCAPRRLLFELAFSQGLSPQTLVHPTAIISKYAYVAEGAQLLPACIVNAGARIGRNAIINSGAIVEHDCVVMDHAHVATGACLASTVTVGEGAHIGAGASVRQCLHIGDGAVVGVGAAVVQDVLSGAVVGGVPARPLRTGKNEGPS